MSSPTAYTLHTDPPATPFGLSEGMVQFLPLLLIGVVFYLMLIRPQQSYQKKHAARLKLLEKGDEVVTAGGIIAKIAKIVDDNEVLVETDEGQKLRIVRSTIATVRDKTADGKAA